MKAKLKLELAKAKREGYAVPAFNFDNLEMMKGIIEASEEEKSPLILMVTESAAKYIGIENVFALSLKAAEEARIPVVLHWDHGFDINLIKRACDVGFSSVMLDASLKPFEENVKETKEVVEYARTRDVDVESEIGHVGGKEDDRDTSNKKYTSLEEAIAFENKTQIDALAIAIGTSHGLNKSKIELQFQLLKELSEKIKAPLVLHGASQVSLSDLQKAISLGITKINIGTDLKIAACNGIRNWLTEHPNEYDARKYGRSSIDEVKNEVRKKIRAFGSNNRYK